MTSYTIFYHRDQVGHASGESYLQAIDSFANQATENYERKYLWAKPTFPIIKCNRKKSNKQKTRKSTRHA